MPGIVKFEGFVVTMDSVMASVFKALTDAIESCADTETKSHLKYVMFEDTQSQNREGFTALLAKAGNFFSGKGTFAVTDYRQIYFEQSMDRAAIEAFNKFRADLMTYLMAHGISAEQLNPKAGKVNSREVCISHYILRLVAIALSSIGSERGEPIMGVVRQFIKNIFEGKKLVHETKYLTTGPSTTVGFSFSTGQEVVTPFGEFLRRNNEAALKNIDRMVESVQLWNKSTQGINGFHEVMASVQNKVLDALCALCDQRVTPAELIDDLRDATVKRITSKFAEDFNQFIAIENAKAPQTASTEQQTIVPVKSIYDLVSPDGLKYHTRGILKKFLEDKYHPEIAKAIEVLLFTSCDEIAPAISLIRALQALDERIKWGWVLLDAIDVTKITRKISEIQIKCGQKLNTVVQSLLAKNILSPTARSAIIDRDITSFTLIASQCNKYAGMLCSLQDPAVIDAIIDDIQDSLETIAQAASKLDMGSVVNVGSLNKFAELITDAHKGRGLAIERRRQQSQAAIATNRAPLAIMNRSENASGAAYGGEITAIASGCSPSMANHFTNTIVPAILGNRRLDATSSANLSAAVHRQMVAVTHDNLCAIFRSLANAPAQAATGRPRSLTITTQPAAGGLSSLLPGKKSAAIPAALSCLFKHDSENIVLCTEQELQDAAAHKIEKAIEMLKSIHKHEVSLMNFPEPERLFIQAVQAALRIASSTSINTELAWNKAFISSVLDSRHAAICEELNHSTRHILGMYENPARANHVHSTPQQHGVAIAKLHTAVRDQLWGQYKTSDTYDEAVNKALIEDITACMQQRILNALTENKATAFKLREDFSKLLTTIIVTADDPDEVSNNATNPLWGASYIEIRKLFSGTTVNVDDAASNRSALSAALKQFNYEQLESLYKQIAIYHRLTGRGGILISAFSGAGLSITDASRSGHGSSGLPETVDINRDLPQAITNVLAEMGWPMTRANIQERARNDGSHYASPSSYARRSTTPQSDPISPGLAVTVLDQVSDEYRSNCSKQKIDLRTRKSLAAYEAIARPDQEKSTGSTIAFVLGGVGAWRTEAGFESLKVLITTQISKRCGNIAPARLTKLMGKDFFKEQAKIYLLQELGLIDLNGNHLDKKCPKTYTFASRVIDKALELADHTIGKDASDVPNNAALAKARDLIDGLLQLKHTNAEGNTAFLLTRFDAAGRESNSEQALRDLDYDIANNLCSKFNTYKPTDDYVGHANTATDAGSNTGEALLFQALFQHRASRFVPDCMYSFIRRTTSSAEMLDPNKIAERDPGWHHAVAARAPR